MNKPQFAFFWNVKFEKSLFLAGLRFRFGFFRFKDIDATKTVFFLIETMFLIAASLKDFDFKNSVI